MLFPKIRNSNKTQMHFNNKTFFPDVNIEIICCFPCFMYFKGDSAVTVQDEYRSEMDAINYKHSTNIYPCLSKWPLS